MVSEMAVQDIEELSNKGIVLTPREIVRLNALGCRCESHPNASSFYSLPRCAFLGDIVFREPTIGQDIWLDNVCRMFDDDDTTTLFSLRAFVLSRNYEDLPDWTKFKKIEKDLKKFVIDVLGKYTLRQVISCINYCMNGYDSNSGEYPDVIPSSDCENTIKQDAVSMSVGVIHEGQALGLGISISDACKMTYSELQAVIQRSYESKGIDVDKSIRDRAIGEYYVTLNNIKKEHL